MYIFTFKTKVPVKLDVKEEDLELCKSWYERDEVLDIIHVETLTRYVGKGSKGPRWVKIPSAFNNKLPLERSQYVYFD